MQDGLSSNAADIPVTAPTEPFPARMRALMLVMNAVPMVHLLCCVSLPLVCCSSVAGRVAAAAVLLFLLPPILSRLVLSVRPLPEGDLGIGAPGFFVWWFLFQLQVLFCRLPMLEETMRLIPGLYSAWLRIWGSRIGRCVYWSAGTAVLERSLLEIGDFVVVGAGVRLNGHVLGQGSLTPAGGGADGLRLLLGRIRIGDRALIGGYSLITAGAVVPAGAITPPCCLFSPFSSYERSKRRGQMFLPLQEGAL